MLTQIPDWHAMRRGGLSSSDLGAVLGKSERRSPRMVQQEKLGVIQPREGRVVTEDMAWGNIMEPYVVARACDRLKARLLPVSDWPAHIKGDLVECRDGDAVKWVVLHSGWPIARSTPDNFAVLPDGRVAVLEAKTTGLERKWKNGPPRSVWMQCQWHMLCAGITLAVVPVLFFSRSRRLAIFQIELHPSFGGEKPQAIDRARAWWEAHIERREPCEAMRLDIPNIDRANMRTDGSTVALPLSAIPLDEEYARRLAARDEARTKLKTVTDELRDVDARVRDAMGKAMFATIDGRPGVTYRLTTDRHGKRQLRRKEKA